MYQELWMKICCGYKIILKTSTQILAPYMNPTWQPGLLGELWISNYIQVFDSCFSSLETATITSLTSDVKLK